MDIVPIVVGGSGLFFSWVFWKKFLVSKQRMARRTFNEDTIEIRQEDAEFSITTLENLSAEEWSVQSHSESGMMTLTILAKDVQSFSSYELLQTLLSAQLQFGDLNLFHYYGEDKQIWFSVSPLPETKVFDLNSMGNFSCVGLKLFMHVNKVNAPKLAFDKMLQTAEQLADDLGGELVINENQSHHQNVLNDIENKKSTVPTHSL